MSRIRGWRALALIGASTAFAGWLCLFDPCWLALVILDQQLAYLCSLGAWACAGPPGGTLPAPSHRPSPPSPPARSFVMQALDRDTNTYVALKFIERGGKVGRTKTARGESWGQVGQEAWAGGRRAARRPQICGTAARRARGACAEARGAGSHTCCYRCPCRRCPDHQVCGA